MKKFLLVLTTILSFSFNTFSQSVIKPFNLDNVDWEIISCGWNSSPPPTWYSFNHYKLCGDSIYQGITYKRIFQGSVTVPAILGGQPSNPPYPTLYYFYGLFRQDSILKRNYLLLPSWNNDSLLMDYNLNVGDTIKGGLYYYQATGAGCTPLLLTVVKIDSVTVRNQKFKVFYTDSMGGTYLNLWRKGYFFIEGLGHLNGIFEYGGFDEYYCHPFEHCPGVDSMVFNAPCNNLAGIKATKGNGFTISVFPNPTNKTLNIQLESWNGVREGSIKIVNIMGEELIAEEIKKPDFEIDVSALPNGIYFLKITDGERSYSKKVIVQH